MVVGQINLLRAVLVVCLLAGAAVGAPSSEQIRKATLDYVLEARQQEGIETVSGYISKRVSGVSRVSSRDLGQLAVAAECVGFLELSNRCSVSPALAEWILGSDERLHVLVGTLSSADNLNGVVQVLEKLYAHDPGGCDKFYDLVVALAVVLDNPSRPRMHRQMGKNLLPYDPDSVWRYDYFKELYSTGTSKIDYEDLSVRELVFVVQIPVPQSELEWARTYADGKLAEWGEKYRSIVYSNVRLDSSRYVWDQGTYTLDAIRRMGGICVDQAYYSVLTARAFGIPAIYFSGAGNSANHAWFAFMEKPGEWQLDIGRYGGSYTTGYAVHPQTRQQMTDHDVEYTCERSLQSEKADQAGVNLTIAEVLLDRDPKSALKCAREARNLVRRYLRAWELEREILTRQKDYDGLMDQYAEQKDVFRKYPYILAESAEEIGKTMLKAGRTEEAGQVMQKLAGVVGEGEDDLAYSLELREIERIVTTGDLKKARREMEQMLENPEYRGNKSFGLIKRYVELTNKSGQTSQAVRFLEDYIEDLVRSFQFPPSYEARLWALLLRACENDGDLKKAADIRPKAAR